MDTTQHLDETDAEERSDDEESDHTPEPYSQCVKGRISPSPYTANTERARQFNAYVRTLIEQRLDVLIPISHQPRELVQDIITDTNNSFPEFSSCVRKRIRTYLKSYRRSKKMKDGPSGLLQNGVKMEEIGGLLSSLHHSHTTIEHDKLPASGSAPPVVTVVSPQSVEEEPPLTKKLKITASPQTTRGLLSSTTSSQNLSGSEVLAVRQLILGYRESAAFLQRAADQLEAMLSRESPQSSS